MRIAIDTNCLLISLPKISKSRWLLDALFNGSVELAVTTDIMEEYEEIIGSFYNSPSLAKNVVETLLNRQNVIKVSPFYFWFLISHDPRPERRTVTSSLIVLWLVVPIISLLKIHMSKSWKQFLFLASIRERVLSFKTYYFQMNISEFHSTE